MNVALELRNEANGVYGRQPEDRYQRLLLVGADYIDDLEERVERLRREVAETVAVTQQLTQLVTEWVDVQPGRTKTDMDRRISIAYDLRKAVGR